MLTAAFGAFSSVVASSLDQGQVAASYLNVGADYRIERIGIGSLDAALTPAAISGVEAVAPVFLTCPPPSPAHRASGARSSSTRSTR